MRLVRSRFPYLPIVTGILLTLTVGQFSPAQTPDPVEQRIERIRGSLVPPVVTKDAPAGPSLADRMSALRVPGVSIAVIHDGKIEWARGFGVTRNGGPSVRPDTLFQAASISKPVTAMAVIRLVQSGKLDLDADVNGYLKTWSLPKNEFTAKQKVTLRELLTHTAGVTVHGFPGYASDAAVPTLVQVLNGEKPANSPAILVDTLPGKEWRYSGGGFVITQLLVQDVTGMQFPPLMHDLVLGPIGMTHSTYEQPLHREQMSEAAMPYRQNGHAVPGGPHVYPEMAPAGLWTTPSDLALFALELQNSFAGKSDKVISAAMAREMLRPGLNKWGLGIETGGSVEHPYFTHSGANEGFQCDMVAYDSGDGAVIMTNSDNGGQLAGEILRTIAYEYKWPDFGPRIISAGEITLSEDVLSRYAGVYEMAPGVNMTIMLDHGQLISQMTQQGKVPLFAESETMFYPKVVDARIEFPKGDGKGPSTQLILHQNGRDMTAKRLSDPDAKKVLDAQAAFDERFAEQKPAAGSEAAVKRMIAELQAGKPNYDLMSPGLANATRQQLTGIQSMFGGFGALQSITFKGVGPGGADIYQVRFEKSSIDYRIWLAPDGKVDSANFRPSE
jgi:CubicO group peptidase (beta-lactamase class C family)